MNKSVIKILKKDAAKNPTPAAVSAAGETNHQSNDVAHTINNWIAERRINSRAETAASARSIAAWKNVAVKSNGY